MVVRWGVLRFGSGLPSPHFSLRVKMDKYLTRKKLATSETATSDKVTDTVDTPDTVDPAAHEEQSQNDSETGEEITSDDNPWPYISSIYTFGILSSIIISRWHGLARSPLVIASEFDSYCLY